MAKKKTIPGSETLKNPKWELFCHLYAGYHNARMFGNGTQCYALAYGYREKINANLETIEDLQVKKSPGYTVKVNALIAANRRMENMCSVQASDTLVNPRIKDRINFLIDNLMTNEFMDRELVFTAMQRQDLNAKIAAIREYNKVKARVSDKLEGELIVRWEDPEDGE